MYHLRAGDNVEWKDIRGIPRKILVLHFGATHNQLEQTLALRQENVKQQWKILLNGGVLGELVQDENPMVAYFHIKPGTLKKEDNELRILATDTIPDDIRVGELNLFPYSPQQLLQEVAIEIAVTTGPSNTPIPSRLTIVNSKHALQPLMADPDTLLATRPGCVYTATGKAVFKLPAGTYTIYAGRGSQYGVDSVKVVCRRGDKIKKQLVIQKEVQLPGWIAGDTHIHTLTYSGHGDASMNERIITITGEGIEIPFITEHNRAIDIDSLAKVLQLRKYFTPVVGDEYTTPVGHFTLFPLDPHTPLPGHQVKDWNVMIQNLGIAGTGEAIILNHARDIHNDFRPFDPGRHLSIAGMELDGWPFPANAMEVMNSSSQQDDIMQLYRDWFGMMNAGKNLTPAGSSDAHDVGRYLVGQARTFIRYDGKDPGAIDKAVAIQHFLQGEVMVSFGLVTEITIENKYGPGQLAPPVENAHVQVKVLGPSWVHADSILLFANGKKIRAEKVTGRQAPGLKVERTWTIPINRQDVYFVAIATGPDPQKPFWPIPRPYQPTSTEWHPKLIGSSGAAWVDGDGDGKKTSASDYAARLIATHGKKWPELFNALSVFDEAVSIQAAAQLQKQGALSSAIELNAWLKNAPPVVKRGFKLFVEQLSLSNIHN